MKSTTIFWLFAVCCLITEAVCESGIEGDGELVDDDLPDEPRNSFVALILYLLLIFCFLI